MGVDVYAVEGSPPCRAVFLVAKAIGVDINVKIIEMSAGEHKTPAFLKMNPAHTVPTMNDNGLAFGESRAISTYLVNKYAPNSSLYPKDPVARGVVDARLYFDAGLFTTIRGAVAPLLFENNLKGHLAALPAILENLQLLETFLGQSAYVAGDQLTIADLSVVANVSSLDEAGIDLSAYPKVKSWLLRMKDLPYYVVNDKGAKMIGGAIKRNRAELESKQSAIDIYAIDMSPPCRAVFLIAKAIGVDLNIKIMDMAAGEHMKPEYLKMNPAHTVPTMNDNGVVFGESRAISTYLINKYAPDSPLYPKDPAARGLVEARLYFDSGLFTAFRGAMYPLLFEKNLEAHLAGIPKVQENLQLLETFLGQSTYVAGDQLTIADLSVVANVSTLDEGGVIDFSAYPKIKAWLAKMKALPCYEANEKGVKMIAGAIKSAKAELGGKK